MFQFRLDATSPYTLRMPRAQRRSEIVALAQKFVAYELTRPEAARTPLTGRLAALLNEIRPHYDHRFTGEQQRTSASEAVKRLDDEAKALVNHIWNTMYFLFKATPERALDWGFEVRQSTRRIIKPQSRSERLALLTRYVAKEESCPEYERFSMPDLAEVKRIRDELAKNLSARDAGQTQRKVSLVATEVLANQMFNHLQSALVYLLTEQYNYKLTPELENWGFEVVLMRNGNGHGRPNGNGASNGHDQNGHNLEDSSNGAAA